MPPIVEREGKRKIFSARAARSISQFHKARAQIDLPQSFAPRSSLDQCIQLDL